MQPATRGLAFVGLTDDLLEFLENSSESEEEHVAEVGVAVSWSCLSAFPLAGALAPVITRLLCVLNAEIAREAAAKGQPPCST